MKKTLTKHQIIDETVQYYKTHPRAVVGRHCTYQTKDGDFCAHSRCLTTSGREIVIKAKKHNSPASDVINLFGDTIHKQQYRGHEKEFWGYIQYLHDTSNNWFENETNGNNLSSFGELFVNSIKEIWEK